MACAHPELHYILLDLETGKKKIVWSLYPFPSLPQLPTRNEFPEDYFPLVDQLKADLIGHRLLDRKNHVWLVSDIVEIPCGHCELCQKARSRDWIIRIEKAFEAFKYNHKNTFSYFLTWTYADEFLPLSPTTGMPTLDKQTFRHMFNTIKNTEGLTADDFQYYAVGEYGDLSARPHYHGIVFTAKSIDWKHYWTFGNIEIGDVQPESIGYVTRYVDKKLGSYIKKEDYELLGIEPIFSIMSKGLGKDFILDRIEKYSDDPSKLNSIIGQNGQKFTLPRYGKKKLDSLVKQEFKKYNFSSQSVSRSLLPKEKSVKSADNALLQKVKAQKKALKRNLD